MPRLPRKMTCGRLQTVASGCKRLRTPEAAGSREQGSTPRLPNVKRERFATHSGKKNVKLASFIVDSFMSFQFNSCCFMSFYFISFIHFIDFFLHSDIHSFHSRVHSCSHSFIHSIIGSYRHHFLHAVLSFIHSLVHSFLPFIHSFRSFIHFIHSFIHSLIHSFMQVVHVMLCHVMS